MIIHHLVFIVRIVSYFCGLPIIINYINGVRMFFNKTIFIVFLN